MERSLTCYHHRQHRLDLGEISLHRYQPGQSRIKPKLKSPSPYTFLLPGLNFTPQFSTSSQAAQGDGEWGTAVHSSHAVPATPSAPGPRLLTFFPAPVWGPSFMRQCSMSSSKVSPSYRLQLSTDCYSMHPFHSLQSFRSRLFQHKSPAGSQFLPGNLFQWGLLSPEVL